MFDSSLNSDKENSRNGKIYINFDIEYLNRIFVFRILTKAKITSKRKAKMVEEKIK